MNGKLVNLILLCSVFTVTAYSSINFKSSFANLTSSFVISDTSSSISLANDSSLIGWKGGSVVQAVDPAIKVDYSNQVISGKLDTIRLKKEYLFEARSYLNSFNLAGETYFDKAWGGDVSHVSVGSAGSVWAIKGSKFYYIDIDGEDQSGDGKFPWHEMGDAPSILSAGRDDVVVSIGGSYGGLTTGAPYYWDEKNLTWNSMPMPAGITSLVYLSVCDKNNVWVIGLDSTGPTYYVFNWHNDKATWIDRSTGSIYPDSGISVGGDGLIDIIILGIKSDPAGDKLVIWDRENESWNNVSIGLSGHTINHISVGRRDNIGIVITPSGSSVPIFYKIENLSRSAPYSATLNEVRKEVSIVEMGYYGDAWFYDPYESYWHRLVGGVIRSVVNYLAQMPNIKSIKGKKSVPSGKHEEEDFTTSSETEITEDTIWGPPPGIESPLSLNGGTMQLKSDVSFSTTTYLVTGGRIDGRGYAIFLGNDFEIPENQSLRFTGTTTIDGQGSALILKNNSQLKVDSGITLSLRNLIVKGLNDTSLSVIQMSENSILSLQNVEFALDGDYSFTTGCLFISDDVSISGTSKFIYESPKNLYVCGHTIFYFDSGTTFSYVPSNGSRDLVKLVDSTATIYLNGCTISAPVTPTNFGIQFTKGKIVFENSVNIENLNNGIANADVNKAITLGDGILSANNVNTEVLADAMLNLNGYLDYNPS